MGRCCLLILMLLLAGRLEAQFNVDFDATKGISTRARRTDQLWHAETARTAARGNGNISLTTASRYGITDYLEVSTYLGFDFFQPNVALKYQWNHRERRSRVRSSWRSYAGEGPEKIRPNRKTKSIEYYGRNNSYSGVAESPWYFASKLNVGNAYTGLKFAQESGYTDYVGAGDALPVVVELGHEFMASYAFSQDKNCSDGSEWLILSGSVGTYYGIEISEGSVLELPYHFLANRGDVLIGDNFLLGLKGWVDWKWFGNLFLHGGFRVHNRNFDGGKWDVEVQGELEWLPSSLVSVRVGVVGSVAKYERVDSRVGVIPILDLTVYLGKPRIRENRLF